MVPAVLSLVGVRTCSELVVKSEDEDEEEEEAEEEEENKIDSWNWLAIMLSLSDRGNTYTR